MKVFAMILALSAIACTSEERDHARKTFCAASEEALSEGELYYLADLKDGIPHSGSYVDGRGIYAIVVAMTGPADGVAALMRLPGKPDVAVGQCFVVAKVKIATRASERRWFATECPEPSDPMIIIPPP
jgi:hypothetical protein